MISFVIKYNRVVCDILKHCIDNKNDFSFETLRKICDSTVHQNLASDVCLEPSAASRMGPLAKVVGG